MAALEFSGKTVEEAIEEGLKSLNLTQNEAEYTVLDEGKKGLFGSRPAKISMCKKRTDGEKAIEFLDGIMDIMHVIAQNELVSDADNEIVINVVTTNTTSVIGHRGEILDSLQVLAGAVANIGREEYKRVVVDCEDYRAKREGTLEKLANKLAEKAVRTGRKVSLEPMTPYERRIIHSAVAGREDVKTQSEGKEPNRHVVFIPTNMRKFERRDRYDRNDRAPRGDRPERSDRSDRGGFSRDRDRDRRSDRPRVFPRPTEQTSGTRIPKPVYFGSYLGNANDEKDDSES